MLLLLCLGISSGFVIPAVAQTAYFAGTPTTVGSGFAFPDGVVVDASGNVYITIPRFASIQELGFASIPSLVFASTPEGTTSSDSPQTLTLTNIGNAPLSLTPPTFPTDFPNTGAVQGSTPSPLPMPVPPDL
jgi:hypothetical protein